MNADKNYCDICNNITKMSTMTGDLLFICDACGTQRKGDESDTLIQSNIYVKSNDKYKILIQFGRYDVVNPSIFKDCPKCKSTIMKFVRIGTTQKRAFLCVKCDYTEM